jgi:hypothetical protein
MPITDPTNLRTLYGEPSERARKKQMASLDAHCRYFIAHSPLCVLSTAGRDGRADASPRGDHPGFVAVLDDRRLLLPDRPGNNRVDSLRNVVENPHAGLLFFVPGVNETLRINGRATIVTDTQQLAALSHQGKMPKSGLLIEIEEVFLHCGKALIRSKLWDPTRHVERKSFPTLGRMLADQIGGMDADETDRSLNEAYRKTLY